MLNIHQNGHFDCIWLFKHVIVGFHEFFMIYCTSHASFMHVYLTNVSISSAAVLLICCGELCRISRKSVHLKLLILRLQNYLTNVLITVISTALFIDSFAVKLCLCRFAKNSAFCWCCVQQSQNYFTNITVILLIFLLFKKEKSTKNKENSSLVEELFH